MASRDRSRAQGDLETSAASAVPQGEAGVRGRGPRPGAGERPLSDQGDPRSCRALRAGRRAASGRTLGNGAATTWGRRIRPPTRRRRRRPARPATQRELDQPGAHPGRAIRKADHGARRGRAAGRARTAGWVARHIGRSPPARDPDGFGWQNPGRDLPAPAEGARHRGPRRLPRRDRDLARRCRPASAFEREERGGSHGSSPSTSTATAGWTSSARRRSAAAA